MNSQEKKAEFGGGEEVGGSGWTRLTLRTSKKIRERQTNGKELCSRGERRLDK